MVTFNLNQILMALLLVAIIVLVIFLIVLVKNAIQTVKKANYLLDEGIETVDNIKNKYSDIKNIVEKSKLFSLIESGLQFVKLAIKKAKDRKKSAVEYVEKETVE